MATKIFYTNWDGLLNQGVADFSAPKGELSSCKNCYCYEIGKLEKTPGYTLADATYNSQILNSQNVNFLYHYHDASANVDYLLAGSNSSEVSPSPSSSISPSISPSRSPSISISISPSKSVSISPSRSPSISQSISPSGAGSVSPSISVSISPSASVSISPSVSPSISASISLSISPSSSPSPSAALLHYNLFYRTTSSWAVVDSGVWENAGGAELSATTFLDRVFLVGEYSGTAIANATLDATTFTTDSGTDVNLLSMPQGKFIVLYKSRLYVLNAYVGATWYHNHAYYSSIPTDEAIDWTVATDFVPFGQDDGDEITGGVEALDRLLVFKHFSVWKYDQSEVKKIADVGCDSYKSIVKIGGFPYWANRNGAWRWGGDSQPQLISKKAKKFFAAMTKTSLNTTLIGVQHDFEYRVHLGDVTVDGYTYNNAWFCFDTTTEKCYIRCTYDEVKSACIYSGETSKEQRAYFGNDNGYVMKFAIKTDNIYSDNGNEIDSFFITHNLDHGDPSVIKHSNHATIFSKHAQGMKLAIDTDNDNTYSSNQGQIITSNVHEMDIDSDAYRFKYKFYEKSKAKSWEWEGMCIVTDIKEQKY